MATATKEKALVLLVTFSDGKTWKIPAIKIAEDRARYYAALEARQGADFDAVFQQEREIALADKSELLDWAMDNMNWEDVEPHASLHAEEVQTADYAAEWTNADMVVRTL